MAPAQAPGYGPAMTQDSSTQATGTGAESAAGDPVFFGERLVGRAEKGGLVRGVFESVASRYDLMNDLMSAGIHRLWKDALVDWLNPRPGLCLVDVAGGTGDIALRVAARLRRREDGEAAPKASRIMVCDLTPDMVAIGRDKALDRGFLTGIDWLAGDAQALPLADRSVDAYSIAFGLRNVTDIDRALKDAYRVLRPGGRFICLEFSRVADPLLRALYDRYSDTALPALGSWVAKDEASYVYLVESIRRFPPQDELAARMTAAGFARVSYRNLTRGVAALHSGWRI